MCGSRCQNSKVEDVHAGKRFEIKFENNFSEVNVWYKNLKFKKLSGFALAIRVILYLLYGSMVHTTKKTYRIPVELLSRNQIPKLPIKLIIFIFTGQKFLEGEILAY